MTGCELNGQISILIQEEQVPDIQDDRPQRSPWDDPARLIAVPYFYLDLGPDDRDLFGEPWWEWRSPLREDGLLLNTGLAPREPARTSLSQILVPSPDKKYYLTPRACLGILRRAKERGKPLDPALELALMMQAGLIPWQPAPKPPLAFHMNQRDEAIDLDEVSGALMATNNMQMQTFITVTPIAFAANQRDEVRDLHDLAGALGAQPGMKQQTFIAQGCLNPWDTQQKRVFLPDGVSPTLAGADGGGGRTPGGLLLTAAFNAGAGAKAGNIGYAEELSPTLKGSPSGNCMPSVLCLNDQGGNTMDMSTDISGTLRAQEHGHQPLVFENNGADGRYRGPLSVAPTLAARAGTGGNNLSLVSQPAKVFSRQRVDIFKENDVVCTQSARQHKDATDLIYQETVGALTRCDSKGPNSQYVSQDKLVLAGHTGETNVFLTEDGIECQVTDGELPLLIRRLVPLECELLQGFPPGWTDIPGASDSARYRACGNSVAVPCVEFIMRQIALVLMLEDQGLL